MEHPQRRTWTMKHPALAKAFAVALVVMSVISIFGGVKNYTEAKEEHEERLRYENRFSERIDNYINLSEKLENSISYDEAWEELEKIIEQHEDDASQHKTDLAMYTAEKGGNTMGANMIWEMLPDPRRARLELEAGKAELAAQEAAMQQAVEGFKMAGGESMAATATQGAATCGTYIAQLSTLINTIDAEPEKPGETAPPVAEKPKDEVPKPTAPTELVEPVAPTAPTEPVEPVAPTEPVLPENPTEEQQIQYDKDKAAYDKALEEYNAKLEAYPAVMEQYEADLETYNALYAQYLIDKDNYDKLKTQYDIDKAKYDQDLAAYEEYQKQLAAYEEYAAYLNKAKEYSDWMNSCMALLASTDLEALGEEAANQGAALQNLAGPATALMDSYKDMFAGMMPSAAPAAAAFSGGVGGGDTLSPEQMMAAARAGADTLKSTFASIQEGYSGIAYGLGAISQGLAAGEAALAEGKALLKTAEEGLHEAQKALEDIWYNLGELEKDRAELEKDKVRLDEEASMLSKEIMAADELRELENDHVSARLLLTSVKEVKEMYAETDDLVGSAEKYLASYKAETETLEKGRLIVSILAIIGGIAGLAGVPAAYELIHKRFWLIWPVVICVVCAAAAEAVYYLTVHEMWYVGLFVAIIAALHLLIVAPKEKKPGIIKET